jgi:hypothetical protein
MVFITNVVPSYADVWIPEDEFAGYFDSAGIYNIVGAVKNTERYPVAPTVTVSVNENGKLVSFSQPLPTVFPDKDIPFKIRLDEVASKDAVLQKPVVTFEKVDAEWTPNVEVIYDKTLVKHKDGSTTGKIINHGNRTEYDLKVYAIINGDGHRIIDVGQSVEKIKEIAPGQVLNFTIYPDPSVASDVNYYSCFAIGDETVVPLYTMRNEKRFDFRYDSTASFVVEGFDETGTELSIYGINSFKVPAYVNFEFPKTSDGEKFTVLVDQKQVPFIQSVDEDGRWHVAFDVDGASQNDIVIKGFVNPSYTNLPGAVVDTQYWYVVLAVIPIAVGAYVYARSRKSKAG